MAVYGDSRLGSAIEQLIGGNFGRADPQAVGQAQLTRARTDRQNQETLAREMLGNAIISSLETGMTPREMMANIYGRGVQISDAFAGNAPAFARGAGLGIYGTDQLGTRMAADLMMGAGDAFSSTEMGFQQAEAGRNSRNAATIAGAMERAILAQDRQDGRSEASNAAAMERAILGQEGQTSRNAATIAGAMERAILAQDRQDGRNNADNAAAMERAILGQEGQTSRNTATIAGAMERAILGQEGQTSRNAATIAGAMERAILGQEGQTSRNDADNAAAMERFLLAEEGRMARAGQTADGTSGGARALTQAELSRVDRMVRSSGFEGAQGAQVVGAIVEAYGSGQFSTLDQAAAAILPGVEMRDVQVGTDPNEFFGPNGTWNPLDMFRGPAPIMEEQLYIPGLGDVVSPPSATPNDTPAPVENTGVDVNTEAVLQEARNAIERGADAEAVRARLRDMGIDPGAL